jgi:hypothetical protein
MTAELIYDESIESYHANPAVSNSKVSVLRDGGPAFFQGRFITKTIDKPKDTDALILGNALDAMMTEGRTALAARYIIKPQGMSFATKEGKQFKADHCDGIRPVIDWDDWTMLERMEVAIKAHPLFPILIHAQAKAQVTIRASTTSYGFALQSRPDWLSLVSCEVSDGLPYSVNLKSTLDFSDWCNEADPYSLSGCSA